MLHVVAAGADAIIPVSLKNVPVKIRSDPELEEKAEGRRRRRSLAVTQKKERTKKKKKRKKKIRRRGRKKFLPLDL